MYCNSQKLSFLFPQIANSSEKERFHRGNSNHRANLSHNIKNKKFKRKKTQKCIFNIMIRILKQKTQQAFAKLARFYILQNPNKYMSTNPCKFSQTSKADINFLSQLKKQRIQSYIHFKTFEHHSYSTEVYRLINLLCKLQERRKSYAILKMDRYLQQYRHKNNQKTVLSGLKEATQASEVYQSELLFYRTDQKNKNVRISYLKVKINNEEQFKNQKTIRSGTQNKGIRFISIRNIQRSKEKKHYEFRSLDSKLLKVNIKNNNVV